MLLNGPAKWYHVCRYRKARAVPYKVYREEILSRSPHLSLLHQVASDAEADKLINVALTKVSTYYWQGGIVSLCLCLRKVVSFLPSPTLMLILRSTALCLLLRVMCS